MKEVNLNKLDNNIFLPDHYFFTQTIGYIETKYHSHAFFEAFYIISGQVIHKVNGVREKLSMGDIVFLRPGDHHMFIYDNSEKFLHTDILFDRNLFEKIEIFLNNRLLKDFLSSPHTLKTHISNDQMVCFENEIQKINNTKHPDDKNSLVLAFLTSLLSIIIKKTVLFKENKYPLWLSQLISQLNVSTTLKESKEEIYAKLDTFCYNKSYISRSFKKYTGITMTEYINNLRFSAAYSLLTSTNYSINDILEYVGLTSKSYFYREFYKRFKITPIQLRNKNIE